MDAKTFVHVTLRAEQCAALLYLLEKGPVLLYLLEKGQAMHPAEAEVIAVEIRTAVMSAQKEAVTKAALGL